MMIKQIFQTGTVLLALLLLSLANAATIEGRWQTIDDETGEAKSIVELYQQNGQLYGKVTKVLSREGVAPNPVCKKCEGAHKDQPIEGMVIIEGLTREPDGSWANGTILDPANGKTYRATIWLENGALKVRGYLGIFFRTQTWQRVN